MTKCYFMVDRYTGALYGAKFEGHADYAPFGQDIVCAAISTATQLVERILCGMFHEELICITDKTKAFKSFEVRRKEPSATASLILSNLETMMYDLEEQFPNFVSVKRML